jgi:hypothetical protein
LYLLYLWRLFCCFAVFLWNIESRSIVALVACCTCGGCFAVSCVVPHTDDKRIFNYIFFNVYLLNAIHKPTTHILPGGRGLEIKYSAPENIEPKQSTNTGATSNGGSTTISIPVLYAGFDFCTTVGVEELTQVRKRRVTLVHHHVKTPYNI